MTANLRRSRIGVLLAAAVILVGLPVAAAADDGRMITRWIAVPKDVSPQAQAVLAGPLNPLGRTVPKTPEAWRQLISQMDAETWTGIVEPAASSSR